MKYSIVLLLVIVGDCILFAQSEYLPERDLTVRELEAHLRFIASDELQGRRTGEPGNNVAARYIATQFHLFGLQEPPGLGSYYQTIPFVKREQARMGKIQWKGHNFLHGEDLMVMSGAALDQNADAVFAGYGWVDQEQGINDYEGIDVRGKVVFVLSGRPDSRDPVHIVQSMELKRRLALQNGAVALVEIYKMNFPWSFFKQNFISSRLEIAPGGQAAPDSSVDLPYFWLNERETRLLHHLKEERSVAVAIRSTGREVRPLPSQNVIGFIEGTDPQLKEEYLLLSAHYDHVGTGRNGGGAFSKQDSIFNGARDNGMGVVALLAAAKSLAAKPPRRSVIVMAVTGEEMGLLGSRYYVENPVFPLKQTVFNLNTDGAGYNDTSKVSVIGFHRVGAAFEMKQAINAFGLEVFPDPAPEQNLFDRSDNVSFAAKGIPAPTMSPGVTGFDATLMQHYHQVSDNPDTIDFRYLHKFSQVFAHAARLIADKSNRPQWKAGDKYEPAGKILYDR